MGGRHGGGGPVPSNHWHAEPDPASGFSFESAEFPMPVSRLALGVTGGLLDPVQAAYGQNAVVVNIDRADAQAGGGDHTADQRGTVPAIGRDRPIAQLDVAHVEHIAHIRLGGLGGRSDRLVAQFLTQVGQSRIAMAVDGQPVGAGGIAVAAAMDDDFCPGGFPQGIDQRGHLAAAPFDEFFQAMMLSSEFLAGFGYRGIVIEQTDQRLLSHADHFVDVDVLLAYLLPTGRTKTEVAQPFADRAEMDAVLLVHVHVRGVLETGPFQLEGVERIAVAEIADDGMQPAAYVRVDRAKPGRVGIAEDVADGEIEVVLGRKIAMAADGPGPHLQASSGAGIGHLIERVSAGQPIGDDGTHARFEKSLVGRLILQAAGGLEATYALAGVRTQMVEAVVIDRHADTGNPRLALQPVEGVVDIVVEQIPEIAPKIDFEHMSAPIRESPGRPPWARPPNPVREKVYPKIETASNRAGCLYDEPYAWRNIKIPAGVCAELASVQEGQKGGEVPHLRGSARWGTEGWQKEASVCHAL